MNNPPVTSSRARTFTRVSTLAAMATASGAHAGIISFDTSITSGSDRSVDWNIDGVGNEEAYFYNSTGSNSGIFKNFRRANHSFSFVTNADKMLGLAAGATIGASNNFRESLLSIFRDGNLNSVTNVVSGVATYIGFRFKLPSNNTIVYGWADVTLTNDGDSGIFTINRWAYEDSGASILAGPPGASAVPEPASFAVGLGALALGAAGLRRRRRHAQAVAA